ncbi:NADAR family protein [Spirillospora sp. CA-253888]
MAGPATVLAGVVYPGGWPDEPGDHLLRNDHPAPFAHRGVRYPTVVHAYWALAAADPADHDRVRAAATPRQARDLGVRAARRAGWTSVRTAVMADLLRAKFAQHPQAAEVLLATGDAALSYTGHTESAFWESRGPSEGRNWIGRLLELVRAELALAREEQRT